MKHVIIGAGAAGITAAEAIRANKPNDEIVIISEDERVVSRCMLHKFISGERTEDALSFVPDFFFDDKRISWLSGLSVTGINTAEKKVLYGDKSESYDKLLIATGAHSVIPPVGALRTAANVFGLRNPGDAKAIRSLAEHSSTIVIIGAGLVGLDAAYALCGMDKDITIVDMAPQILAANLDARAASAYQTRFENAGCRFILGTGVSDTVANDTNDITGIVLADGQTLPCDMVIVAVGVRPAAEFTQGSGIETDRSINVDSNLRTSVPDVYAAGDVAGLSGTWPNARRQGEIAAMNMCGVYAEYSDTFAAKNTVNFFGLVTLSLGTPEPEPGDTVSILEDRNVYKKIIIRENRVVGIILQGNISNSGFWQYLIKKKVNVKCSSKPVWKLSYADFCALDKNGEYIYLT